MRHRDRREHRLRRQTHWHQLHCLPRQQQGPAAHLGEPPAGLPPRGSASLCSIFQAERPSPVLSLSLQPVALLTCQPSGLEVRWRFMSPADKAGFLSLLRLFVVVFETVFSSSLCVSDSKLAEGCRCRVCRSVGSPTWYRVSTGPCLLSLLPTLSPRLSLFSSFQKLCF